MPRHTIKSAVNLPDKNIYKHYLEKQPESVDEIICELAKTALEPSERISVSECATKYRYLNQPGSYIGPWYNETTPYLVEPMNMYASHKHNGLIFIGPSQSGKTDALLINTLLYSILIEPMDTMIVGATRIGITDFSHRRVDRLHRYSEKAGKMLLGGNTDHTLSKIYKTGMLLSMSWPSPTELASKPIAKVLLTERDRMSDDVYGEGEVFDLATKRTTTFGSYAMTVCESSPSREVENSKWVAQTPHEGPPAPGIMALYNRGDKRRWYWPCPHCNSFFEAMFQHLVYDTGAGNNTEISMTAKLKCPTCHKLIEPNQRYDMNLHGVWVPDNQSVDRNGNLVGPTPNLPIASYWLRGTAAAFTSWPKLVNLYLDAEDDYKRTNSEESSKKFWNNDMGEPYYRKRLSEALSKDALMQKSQRLPKHKVLSNIRFLIGTADVQKNMWVCQVFGVSPGVPFDITLIDRFDIRKSNRKDEDGDTLWVKPSTYLEDWQLLREQLLQKEYELDDDSGRVMKIRMVACDCGGEEGVTTMAYSFYRSLREVGEHHNFVLCRGLGGYRFLHNPRTRVDYPDARHKTKHSGAMGDVPVLCFNSLLLKDDLAARLECTVPGKGLYRIPSWVPDWWYDEMSSEQRTVRGWIAYDGRRNEAWDLSYYAIGLCISEYIRVEAIDWENPPKWAEVWDKNAYVYNPNSSTLATPDSEDYTFAKLGKLLG
jgi:phage terminase large subunit GpA-like protein